MHNICKGCGVTLQSSEKNRIGYTPKMDATYCMRCFRIRHYDDVVISMKQDIDSDTLLQRMASMEALIVWVVDVFDFEANMVVGINRHLFGKDILMVVTKRDLLPSSVGDEKISQFILARLKALGILVQGIVICGDLAGHVRREDNACIEDVEEALAYYRKGRDVIVMGMANAGKSTLLNAICKTSDLTTSRHLGTTLEFRKIQMENYTLYDTPGVTRMDSLLTHIDDSLLKKVIPLKPVKARVYQLRDAQTLSLGGLVRLDLIGCENVSCVAYFSERLPLHRSKQEKADELWKLHYGTLLSPHMDACSTHMKVFELHNMDTKTDVVIHGLGWFCIQGHVETLRVFVPQKGTVTFRKGMI